MLGDLPFGRNGLLVSKDSLLPGLFVAAVCLSGSWKVERWSFRSQLREEGIAAPSDLRSKVLWHQEGHWNRRLSARK